MPRLAIAEISELTGCEVYTESIDFKLNGTVFIKNLVIKPYASQGPKENQAQQYDNTLLKAKTVYARFGIGSLFLSGPRLKEIYISDFVFNAQYNLDTDRWNLAAFKLNTMQRKAGKIPLIILNGGMLQHSRVSKEQTTVLTEVPIDVKFRPFEKIAGGYSFNITTAEKAVGTSTHTVSRKPGRSRLIGNWLPGRITVSGGISSAGIPELENALVIDTIDASLNYDSKKNFLLNLKVGNLSYPKESVEDILAFGIPMFSTKSVLFTSMQRFFERYNPAGKIDAALEVSGNFNQLSKSTINGHVLCKDITICNQKFPYILKHVTGQVDFTENSAILNDISGKHDDVNVTIGGWIKDFGLNQRYQIQITSDNMALDDDLYEALNPKQKEFWTAFSPGGSAAIDYRFSKAPPADKWMSLVVELRDSEAAYRNFPYPLKNLKGKLYFDYDSITVDNVVSQENKGMVTINGKVLYYGTDNPIYNLSVKAGDMPLDTSSVKNLLARQDALSNQCDVTGLVDADIKIFTSTQDKAPTSSKDKQISPYILSLSNSGRVNFFADVNLKQASLTAKKTGLTISDISAKIHLAPDSTNIKNFAGHYGQSTVSLIGGIWLGSHEAGALSEKTQLPRYFLAASAPQAQLNDELIGLLPLPLAKIVSDLQPSGKVNISANLRKMNNDDKADSNISVDCLGNGINAKMFPYPLKDVTGRLTVKNKKITFNNITAVPDDGLQSADDSSLIQLSGQINLAGNNFSNGLFQLSARNILLGENLACAMPADISSSYQALSPAGRFDLELENVNIFKFNDGEKLIDFNASVGLKNCSFNLSGTRAELNAALKSRCLYKSRDGFSDGQIAVLADNFNIKGKSIKNLTMDLNYDQNQRRWSAENLIADCYNGKLAGQLEISPASGGQEPAGDTLKYMLQTAFNNIDLRQFLLDDEPNSVNRAKTDHTSGTMSGSLSLRAQIGDNSSRVGRCMLNIKDMQVGKLSPLAKLLYVLKLTEPKNFAFERMVVDSYIKSDTLIFDKFDLAGEAVAFHGSGRMDLQSANVELSLTARGQRIAGSEPSLLGSLTEGLGKAVVRMEVTGNFKDPKVETKLAPVVEDSLKIFGTPR